MQIIYAECLIEKVDGCKIHSQKRVGEHVPSDFSVPITSSFKSTKNKYGVYRDKDCMKKFCEYLREHGMKIINFKGKKMRLLTNDKYAKNKKYCKARDHYHHTGEHRDAEQCLCWSLCYYLPSYIMVRIY